MELPKSEPKVTVQPWKRTTAALTLETIPEECLFNIMARLSAPQLSQARLACKALAAVGKRPDLPPRQEQLQLALTARGDDSLLVLGMRQRQKAQRPTWAQLLQQPGARETLRHMPALELMIVDLNKPAEYCREMFLAVASCLEGSATLRKLHAGNLHMLDDDAAALGEGSTGFLHSVHHLDLDERGPIDVTGSFPPVPAALCGLNGLRSLRFSAEFHGQQLPAGAEQEEEDQEEEEFRELLLTLHSSREPEEGGGPGKRRLSPASVLDPASFQSLEFQDCSTGRPDWSGLFRAIAEAPPGVFAGLTSLSFDMVFCGDDDVAALARAPAARGLTSLHLSGDEDHVISLEAVRALAGSAELRCLKDLGLENARLSAEGPEPAGEPAALQGLTTLSLTACDFNSEGARALERYLSFSALQTLTLGRCSYDEGGDPGGWLACIKRWAAAAKGLTGLSLASNYHNRRAELEVVLSSAADLPELSALRICGGYLKRPATVAHLACMSRLEDLDLAGIECGDACAGILASSPPSITSLQRLVLDSTRITVAGLQVLTASPVLKELVDLSLAHCCLKDEGAAVLAVAPSLTKLTCLCLRGNEVGDSGALALSTSSTLRELAVIRLDGGGRTTFVGANHLALSTSLISLKYVHWRW